MGTVMCFIPLLFNLGEWAPGRRLYSPSEKGRERRGGGVQTGLSIGTITVRPSSGYTHYMHEPSLFAWHTQRGLSNGKLCRGHPPGTICR